MLKGKIDLRDQKETKAVPLENMVLDRKVIIGSNLSKEEEAECRCFTTDSLPQGYRGSIVRASAYAELDGKRKRQSIYPGSGPRS